MGAWGHKSFENDDALDWLSKFARQGAKAAVVAFEAVNRLNADDYLELPEAAAALAAAEFVAAARDGYVARLPTAALGRFETVRSALSTATFVNEAKSALQRVMNDSELRELRFEGKDGAKIGAAWLTDVITVFARLK